MRELKTNELEFVSGGLVCTQGEAGNVIYGISDPKSIGGYIIDFYEGLIEATSYAIERVANSF
jgi:hypothetical protein